MTQYELLKPIYDFPAGTICYYQYWEGKGFYMHIRNEDTDDYIMLWIRNGRDPKRGWEAPTPNPEYFKKIDQ